jgi:sugar lactone lactonase YvrE
MPSLEHHPRHRPWRVTRLAWYPGALENVLPDGDGGLLLSALTHGKLLRFDYRRRAFETVAEGLPAIGGLVRQGEWLYCNSGNAPQSGLLGRTDGSIFRLRLDRPGARPERWASGLIMPNGLALLPDGSAVVTRNVYGTGRSSGVTRVTAGASEPEYFWSDLRDTNGAALDATGETLYVTRTFTRRAEIWGVPVNNPEARRLVADLGPGLLRGLDDLAIGRDGHLYVAADFSGSVYRVHIDTGAFTRIAGGMPLATAVAFGDGNGLPADRLYVTTLWGGLFELTPPG